MLRNEAPHVLVILCYRSNEVDQHHPFQQFLDEVRKYPINLQKINVQDLHPNDVSALIEDSLHCTNQDLSTIVYTKTHGNAFFVHQLLKGLADQGHFQLDTASKVWTIDLEKVSILQVSNNVVDFMQTRLQRLPDEVTDLLSTIGAIGHNVNVEILAVITGKSRDSIWETLKFPLDDGLLYQKEHHVYFSHDKIQQACYQLNQSSDLPRLHFTIANTLIEHDRFQSLDDLFNIVGHLNKSFVYIREDVEKYIEIYMMAALKSKDISAYKEFLVYVQQAMSLLHDLHSDSIRYRVYREYHIALYLNSLFTEADAFFYEKLIGYANLFELKENYFSKVSQDSMLRNYKAATEFGMSILKKMGIELAIDPALEDLAAN